MLGQLAKPGGNGLVRIAEVFAWSSVSTRAGTSREELSFQRGMLTLIRVRYLTNFALSSLSSLQFLTSRIVLRSIVERNKNALFNLIHENLKIIVPQTIALIGEMVRNNRVADISFYGSAGSPSLFVPQTMLHVFQPVAALLDEYLARMRLRIGEYPDLVAWLETFRADFETWATAITASSPRTNNDTLANDPNKFTLLEKLRADIERLHRTAGGQRHQLVVSVRPAGLRPRP